MDSIRFEPTVSATFAVDRNPGGQASDMFADMLGDQLKKRSEAERHDNGVRRRPNGDRRLHGDDHPAGRRPQISIRNAHEFNDTATTARDVTPNRETQPTLPAPAQDHAACMDDEATEGEIAAVAPDDKETQTGDEQAPAIEAPAEETPEIAAEAAIVVAIDADATPLVELPAGGDIPAEIQAEAEIAPAAEPAQIAPAAEPAAEGAAQVEDEAAKAGFAANLTGALDSTMAGLMTSDAAATEAALATQTLASASLTSLAAPKSAAPVPAEAQEAAAVELAAKITPEAPRAAAETKPRQVRATPAAEIRAQLPANQPAQAPAAPQAAATTPVPVAALGDASAGAFDAGLAGEGAAAPGWALNLAQGAAAKRPDFIAQLRQHLQELPAHEQVAVNIQRAMREGTGRLTIQLSPAELGKIHVKLEIDEEKRVTAAVTVEKPSTLELLQRDVKALERALQDAGLKMDGSDLSFSLGRQDGEEFAQDMRHAGSAGHGKDMDEGQADGDAAAAQAAQVDTAAGLVNVQI